MSATFSWSGDNDGDWNSGSLWSGGTIPTPGANATIDVLGVTQPYTITIASGESVAVNTLTLNAPNDTTNQSEYLGAVLQVNGTLTFGSTNSIDGSLQSEVLSNGGTFINAGTLAPFIQGSGTVLFTGTNAVYIENELQSDGTVIVSTPIAELIGNTLTDGIFYANGSGTVIDLGGAGTGNSLITAIEGPQGNPTGWTELTYYGTGSAINQWDGTAYTPVANSLTTIMSGGTVDVEDGALYGTTNVLTINNAGSSAGTGMLNIQGGTIVAAGVTLTQGILQGYGTVVASLVNNGTIIAEGGILDLTGEVTGTGTILFDRNIQQGTVAPGGATLIVGTVAAGQTFVLNADDTLIITSSSDFAGTIEAGQGGRVVLDNSDGSSFVDIYNPASGVSKTVSQYSSANGTGTLLSETINSTAGTSLRYVHNPTSTTSLTVTQYSGPNDTGPQTSEVVDNTNGQALVYAYNPSGTVSLTAQLWSATNTTNGAPTGSEISDVVDNTNGTSLLYSYNPTSSVKLTVAEYSATNSTNGAPAGNQISDVVDETNGTSILYAYNPASGVTQTVSFYSSTNPTTGAPSGSLTEEVIDYTSGESAVTTYNAQGTPTTHYYSGPNGTGSSISGITTTAAATPSVASPGTTASDGSVINVATSSQLVDPGAGSFAIHFASAVNNDTLMLHAGGTDQVTGFSISAGDKLDLHDLLSAAHVSIGSDMSQLSNYVSVNAVNGSAQVLFDPTGHGGGSQVALLVNDANLVPQLQTLKSFTA